VPLRDPDFVTATSTAIDPGIRCTGARRVLGVISRIVGLIEVLTVFVLCHVTSPF